MTDRIRLEDVHKAMQHGASPSTFVIQPDPVLGDNGYNPSYKMTPAYRAAADFCTPSASLFNAASDALGRISGPVADIKDFPSSARLSSGMYSSSAYGGVFVEMDGVYLAQPRYNIIDVQSYLLGNAWHYAAVMAKATAATELGYIWKYSKKNQLGVISDATAILSHFEERIYEANHKDLGALLKEQAIDYFTTGNKTIEIGYTVGGDVDCLYSVPAITVFRHPTLPIACQALTADEMWGSIVPFSPRANKRPGMQLKAVMPLFMSGWSREDILQALPYVDPELVSTNTIVHVTNSILSSDPIYGVADILPALSSMFGDNAANDYNWQFFENNAIPRYAVTISGGRVTPEVRNMIVEFFNREIRGKNHRTIVLPLPREMTADFKALDATPNEASFIDYKKLNREEIAAVHRVPPSELGLWEDANKANSTQQSKNFNLKVIKPYQSQDMAMINRILAHGLGLPGVSFEFKNVEYTDDQEKATVRMTKANGHKMYVSGLVETITAINELATKVEKPKPGGPTTPTKTQASGDDSPILSKAEAKSMVKILLDKIVNATEIFEINMDSEPATVEIE